MIGAAALSQLFVVVSQSAVAAPLPFHTRSLGAPLFTMQMAKRCVHALPSASVTVKSNPPRPVPACAVKWTSFPPVPLCVALPPVMFAIVKTGALLKPIV